MEDLFSRPTVLQIAAQNADKLSAEFLEWLPENLEIWSAFERETFRVINRGFKHYSSYTIVEFLRHHTAVAEVESEFKINNNIRPYLSRLFDFVNPQHAGLFEYRVTTKRKGREPEAQQVVNTAIIYEPFHPEHISGYA